MKISYINKDRVKEHNENEEILSNMYGTDIRKEYARNKVKLTQMGMTEDKFTELMKQELGI